MLRSIVLLIVAFGSLLPIGGLSADSQETWSKSVFFDGSHIASGKQISLDMIRQDETHLIGIVALRLTDEKASFVVPLHQSAGEAIRPSLALEVGDGKGSWQIVDSSLDAPVDATLTMVAGRTVDFEVAFDALKPLLDKHRFARIRFKTGEVCVFPLSILAKPSSSLAK